MIYSLRGKLIHVGENTAVIECGGVGYLCSTTRTTLNALPAQGSEVMLYTYMNVREGAIDLFGFATIAEQNCFRRLTSVSGVGPKVALASGSGNIAEAVSALVVLGYSQSEAARAIAGQPAETSVQDLIKTGLKKLAGSR